MATAPNLPSTDAAILTRLVQPERADLPSEAAQALLQLHFNSDDLDRLHALTVKNQGDELTASERSELESYLRISSLLDLMQAKARLSLRGRSKDLPP